MGKGIRLQTSEEFGVSAGTANSVYMGAANSLNLGETLEAYVGTTSCVYGGHYCQLDVNEKWEIEKHSYLFTEENTTVADNSTSIIKLMAHAMQKNLNIANERYISSQERTALEYNVNEIIHSSFKKTNTNTRNVQLEIAEGNLEIAKIDFRKDASNFKQSLGKVAIQQFDTELKKLQTGIYNADILMLG